MLEINAPQVETVVTAFIRDCIHKNRFENAILGVSGGVDSAVVLALAQRALGAEHLFGLLMPYCLSSPDSLTDGKSLCDSLGVASLVVDISPPVDAYFERHPTDDRVLIGNKCARERMSVLYDFSARRRALVVGTSNKSELLVGYSTIFGDSAAAFMPIGDLYKTQVLQLAEHLEIPENIRKKVPSADLWSGQSDEADLGITYRELDQILYHLVDLSWSEKEIVEKGHSPQTIRKIKEMIIASQYKRTLPPVAKLQPRTVGIDFRYPRDWKK